MYRLIPFFLLLTLPSTAQAQRYDTLFTRPVGPGIVHSHIIEHDVPWNVHVLEIELDNPYLEIQAELGHGRLGGFERILDMARRVDEPGARVIGAINGDFFSGSAPVSMHIGGGHVARRETSGRPGIGFTSENRPSLEFPVFSATLTDGTESISINGVNQARGTNQTILFNQHFGTSTGTDASGTEVTIVVPDGWSVNDTLRAVVQSVRSGAGDSSIEPGAAVLSASGSAAAALEAMAEDGDTLSLFVGALPGPGDLQDLVSGGPFIVANGAIDVGPRGDAVDRHPRTAIGINADSTKLYMVTVDGRQAISAGMDLWELASFMVELGVHTAINLDGGGSTTMVIRNEMANRSSDGGLGRPVANGLLAISTAPEGDLHAIRLPFDTFRIFRGHAHTFSVQGIDEYYHPVPFDTTALVFDVDASVGTIDQSGNLVTNLQADTGFVYVRLGEFADTMRVIVKDVGHVAVSPPAAVTDTTRTLSFSVETRDTDGILQTVSVDEFDWSVGDPSVGAVTEAGSFRGLQPGTTDVIVAYGTVADTATVTVEVGEGTVLLNDMARLDDWSVETVNLREEGTGVEIVETDDRPAVLKVNYNFLYGEGGTSHQLLLHTDELLYGVPDSIHLDVLSDGRRHRVFFVFEDNVGQEFSVYVPQFVSESEFYDRLGARIDRAGMIHPIRLKTVALMFGTSNIAGEPDQGALYLDSLRISYTDRSAVSAENDRPLPERVILHPNYPNPFNPSTTIRYELPHAAHVSLRVYNVLGQLVETLVDAERPAGSHDVTWEVGRGATVSSGLYFYVLESEGRRTSRSMVLLK